MPKEGTDLLQLTRAIGFYTIDDEYPVLIMPDHSGWMFERGAMNPRPIGQDEIDERDGMAATADEAAELLKPDEWAWLEDAVSGGSKKNSKSSTVPTKLGTKTASLRMRVNGQDIPIPS